MKTPNKLVRDNIPSIIQNRGQKVKTRILDDNEYKLELNKKLQEEVNEFFQDDNCEELADILEVVYALAAIKGSSYTQLEDLRLEKSHERGGFQEKIFLETIED